MPFGQEDDISVMSIVGDLICFVLKKLDVAESPKHSSRGFRSIERALFGLREDHHLTFVYPFLAIASKLAMLLKS
jgi:hypothetical protein